MPNAATISPTSRMYLLTWNSAPTSEPLHAIRNSIALPSVR